MLTIDWKLLNYIMYTAIDLIFPNLPSFNLKSKYKICLIRKTKIKKRCNINFCMNTKNNILNYW